MLFKMLADKRCINGFLNFLQVNIFCTCIKRAAGAVENMMHHFLVASAKNKTHIFHLLHARAKQCFCIFFGIIKYLLKLINSNYRFDVLPVQYLVGLYINIYLYCNSPDLYPADRLLIMLFVDMIINRKLLR